jgi:hypothetical protein
LRTTGPDEIWHIDTTVIRMLAGTHAFLHAVIPLDHDVHPDVQPQGTLRILAVM